ncbi:hypothetical protein Q3G72_032239 [Acer saccharum]|nr:hypothetical protein Q3G72_032239 [Acer saccharum]
MICISNTSGEIRQVEAVESRQVKVVESTAGLLVARQGREMSRQARGQNGVHDFQFSNGKAGSVSGEIRGKGTTIFSDKEKIPNTPIVGNRSYHDNMGGKETLQKLGGWKRRAKDSGKMRVGKATSSQVEKKIGNVEDGKRQKIS